MESQVSIQVLKTIREMQDVSDHLRHKGKKISVVPTMGYLHQGHASLIKHARSCSDKVIVTVFVNPAQFSPNEDFTRYPRDFDRDKSIASEAGADILFFPDILEMYPADFNCIVEVPEVSNVLEGAFRPNHFRGVTTVVLKLFNITKPHIAIFGQKDAQQAFILRKMAKDLNFDVDIIVAPIIRETDGLAMSSRNIYLDESKRRNALVLFRSLQHVKERIQRGELSVAVLREEMRKIIQSGSPSQIDYIAFVDPVKFSEIDQLAIPEVLVLLAVRFGTTRLIDNTFITITQ